MSVLLVLVSVIGGVAAVVIQVLLAVVLVSVYLDVRRMRRGEVASGE